MAYPDISSESNRDLWEFTYNAAALAAAALAKRDCRQSRSAWWKDQQEAVMKEVKESGIEVQEAVGAQYSNTTAVHGGQIVVRTDLQRKLNECHAKIREHDAAAREYDGWVQILSANKDSELKLKQSDWLYFFGAN